MPAIADAMKKDRHCEILANLSFATPEQLDTLPMTDKLRKLRPVYDALRELCRDAWDVELLASIIESRCRLLTRMCSFVTTMMCKPIKVGVTWYCLVFESGYLYDFELFTGSGDHDAPAGQPTDVDDLDEDDDKATGYILPLVLRLVEEPSMVPELQFFTDKAFTSLKLARHLAKRAVALVGMNRSPSEETEGRRSGATTG